MPEGNNVGAIAIDPFPTNSLEDVDRNLERYGRLQKRVDRLKKAHDAKVSRMKAKLDTTVQPLLAEQDQLKKSSLAYLAPNRAVLIREHKKIIPLKNGEISWKVIPRHLSTPRTNVGAVNFLLKFRGGMKYLSVKYSLDRDALATASPGLLRRLAPFGIKMSSHENLNFKPKGFKDPVVLQEKPYGVRRK